MTKRPQSNLELIRRVLGGEYLEFHLRHLTMSEDATNSETSCRVVVTAIDNQDHEHAVEGTGSGPVDALFQGLLSQYAREYPSLKSIELVSFKVDGLMSTKHSKSGGDAMGTVTVDVRNSEGALFSFADESRSIVASSARAVLAIVEYFVNAERAFITLYRSRKDAQERNRTDLVARYTQEMAEVVKSTSYTEVIESIKSELK